MTGFGPYEAIPWLLLPVLLILMGTSIAIIRKPDATVDWVLRTALLGALATGAYALLAVRIFTLVMR